jgi:hypothetical protein
MMRFHVARAAALLLSLTLAAVRGSAQTSQLTTTYTSVLTGSPVASDFVAGRVVVGFVDVAVTRCGRNPCTVRMRVPVGSSGSSTLLFAISPTAPALSACSTPVPTVAFPGPPVILSVAAGSTGTLRVYFCYDLAWTTSPPATFVPGVRFQIQNGP